MILPIGISFYVFQAISYVVDVYRGDAKHADNLIDFAAFMALFPQLVAGPVLRYKDLADQFDNRTHSFEKFAEGATRFMQGLAKKVLIADTVAPIADMFFSAPDPTMAEAWLGALAYAIQLYFDFSGYSTWRSGWALMIGFRFTENFKQPYISALDHRVLAALAHQPVGLAARLPLHPAGRQPQGHGPDLHQPVPRPCCWAACGTARTGPSSSGAPGTAASSPSNARWASGHDKRPIWAWA